MGLLAEVLVVKGMGMRDMLALAREEVMVRVCSVGVGTPEGLEPKGGWRDWEDGEERVCTYHRR